MKATAATSGGASGASNPLAIIFTLPEALQDKVYEEFFTLGTVSRHDLREGHLLFSQPQNPVRGAELSLHPNAVLYAHHALALAQTFLPLRPGADHQQSVTGEFIASIRCWPWENKGISHYWLDTMTTTTKAGVVWLQFIGFDLNPYEEACRVPVAQVRMTPQLLAMAELAARPRAPLPAAPTYSASSSRVRP